MKSLVSCVVLLAGLAGVPQAGQAQRRGRVSGGLLAPEAGPRVGYDFHSEGWSVGGQLRIPGRYLETILSGDSYFTPGSNPWQLNADLVLRLGSLRALYAGGGIGFFHTTSTDAAANIVVGLHPARRRRAPVRPYVEGRWTFLNGATPFRLVFGVNLVLGR